MTKKPFFRAFDGWWYAQLRVGGKRVQKKLVRGEENEAEAYRLFYKLMAQDPASLPEPTNLKVAHICDSSSRIPKSTTTPKPSSGIARTSSPSANCSRTSERTT